MDGIFTPTNKRAAFKNRLELEKSWNNGDSFQLVRTSKVFTKNDFPKYELLALKSKKVIAVILNK